jgi:hypothetical protein
MDYWSVSVRTAVESSFPLSRAWSGLSIVPIIAFETCGPAKAADISLNIRSIFVRAGVGKPIIFLIPKHFSDVRRNSSRDRSRSTQASCRSLYTTKQAACSDARH